MGSTKCRFSLIGSLLLVLPVADHAFAQPVSESQIRAHARLIIAQSGDSGLVTAAQRYLAITSVRSWSYIDRWNNLRLLMAVFEREQFDYGRRWVKFVNYQPMRYDDLTLESQQAVEAIPQLRSRLEQSYRNNAGADIVKRIKMIASTKIELGGEQVTLQPGSEYAVVERRGNNYFITVAGERVGPIPKNNVQPIESAGPSPKLKDILAGLDGSVDFILDGETFRAKVTDLVTGGMGDQAKVKIGDMIMMVDGHAILSTKQFKVDLAAEGTKTLTVRRGNSPLMKIVIGDTQPTGTTTTKKKWPLPFGVGGQEDDNNEFVIGWVFGQDSVAKTLGLDRGDKILAVNSYRISREADLILRSASS